MEYIHYEIEDGVAVATMQRGKSNPLNHAMVGEMLTAVEQAAADPAVRAFVLASDRSRFFSPGFDVTEVFTYDRERIGLFLNQFARMMDQLQWMPKPTVAALSGHTYAGGALAALCADFRVMADDAAYGFALTEVNIGVRLPASVFLLLSTAAGVPLARRSFLTGDPIRPAEGLQAGLFHALYREGEVRTQSIALAKYLATKPPATYAAIKEKVLLTAGLRRLDAASNWIDPEAWFTPEAEQMKRQLAEKLKR
ncbi:MAG: enoyl-CoA hydratase/isomerase family protein [Bryobacteraceae bacterium]|nr:enoyl-CoA hydratase/isomerase family protein [Bryobacteraceae bacterium]